MSELKREVRYTVIKHSQLTEIQMQYLKGRIFTEGIPTVRAVVVESDWPEFEPVWKMIEDRVSGAPVEGGKAEYDALAQAVTTNQTIGGVPCTHEWTDDGEFLLTCTACGAQEDYTQALQLAFELGGTDDGAYHLEADELCEVIRRYAEQPSLVAVVLLERRAVSPARDQAMCANSWNACLDELKRLNPSL